MFNSSNWYWMHASIGLFSSASRKLIEKDDEVFQAWCALGNSPTPWPCDANGKPSISALDDVLAPYGLTSGLAVDLPAYTASMRYQIETGGIKLPDGTKIATDRESQSMIGNAVQIASMTGKPVQFKAGSGFVELTPEQMQGVALAVAAHVQASFAAEAAISAEIAAGTITDTDQIDASFREAGLLRGE